MRRRITYIQPQHVSFHPSQTTLTPNSLAISNLVASREERVTLGFDELTGERLLLGRVELSLIYHGGKQIWQVLKQCHQVHVRWARSEQYDAVSPYSSRVSPGLHVFYSPIPSYGDSAGLDREALCKLLKKVFEPELGCESPEKSFITPPILSTRFASTAAYQFYELLPSLKNLVTYIQQKHCEREDEECYRHVELISSADSIDINYDSISHSLTMSGYWSKAPGGADGWTEVIRKHKGATGQVEVGLLGAEPANDPEEIKMGGLLAVVGEDTELKPTLFSFPSRHHPLPEDTVYSVSFSPPTGLHPTMTISMSREALKEPSGRPDAACALHAYLTLPSSVFGDKYQLSTSDELFLKSHNLVSLRAVAGETDLEAPDWFVPRWGSNWLLELASPSGSDQSLKDWNVTIPLHLRYLNPSESGYRSVSVPWPAVFWACTAEDGTKMAMNPFDRVNLGWEGLFGPKSMFYQLHPSPNSEDALLVEELEVPVLTLKEADGLFQSRVIELGTVAVLGLGFLWVLWKLGLVARSSGIRSQQRGTDKRAKAE
ncbi:PIG-X [Aspergillus pseudoustus]|uniref:Protein PBN1 n=1 Tax=Aspergillus pseudoustus TaxID=1810923 RepID=A0ABR4KKZ9_9EURO